MAMLSKETGVSIGLMILIVAGVLWVDRRLAKIEFQLTTIQKEMEGRTGDRWSASDMKHWTELLKISNPAMTVPAPTASE